MQEFERIWWKLWMWEVYDVTAKYEKIATCFDRLNLKNWRSLVHVDDVDVNKIVEVCVGTKYKNNFWCNNKIAYTNIEKGEKLLKALITWAGYLEYLTSSSWISVKNRHAHPA